MIPTEQDKNNVANNTPENAVPTAPNNNPTALTASPEAEATPPPALPGQVVSPGQPAVAPPSKPHTKVNKWLIIGSVILLVVAVGVAWFLLFGATTKTDSAQDRPVVTTKKKAATNTATPVVKGPNWDFSKPTAPAATEAPTPHSVVTTAVDSQMSKTTFTYGPTVVSVTHLTAWKPVDTSIKGYDLPAFYIKSEKDNYLHLFTTSGVGGYCENGTTFTLTHKIPTASADYSFTEYSIANTDYPTRALQLESKANRLDGNTTENVGDTGKDSCAVVADYSQAGTKTSESIFITMGSADLEQSSKEPLTFAQAQDDSAFMDMLKTLSIK